MKDYYKPNPFMELIATAENLWHERKGLDHTHKGHRRQFQAMQRLLVELKKKVTVVEKEFEFIKDFYKIPD